jgi:surface protein
MSYKLSNIFSPTKNTRACRIFLIGGNARVKSMMTTKKRKTLIASNQTLGDIIQSEINQHGLRADLNHIDVSHVTDMTWLFEGSDFNGDISKWDVGSVTNMNGMFEDSDFNGDISRWDVKNVEDMCEMFPNSRFNGNIGAWNVENVTDMDWMFDGSEFRGDIGRWSLPVRTFKTEDVCDRIEMGRLIQLTESLPKQKLHLSCRAL